MIDSRIIWEESGRKGLILSSVSIAYLLLGTLFTSMTAQGGVSAAIATVSSTVAWMVKTGLCIYLLWKFMSSFAAGNNDCDNSDSYRFGARTSFCSALVFSAFYLAYTLFIQPDTFSEAVRILAESGSLPSEYITSLESMLPSMPAISFISNLLYCWIVGIIFSAIFSKFIPSQNPFEGEKNDEEKW